MIAVIDTGGANLASVSFALQRLGVEGQLTSDAHQIRLAEKVILPGVGAAKDAMDKVRAAGLVEVIRGLQQPTLGICLGMQLLFSRSTEGGDVECLGLIPGTVRKMKTSPELRLPHMGWNALESGEGGGGPLLAGVAEGSYVYFVHSFQGEDGPWVQATCRYGVDVPAVVQKDNFFGAQFHPERSTAAGAQILRNFLSL